MTVGNSPDDYRRGFSALPTAVTIVTADSEHGALGMTANSVTSVSLSPPMLGLFPARTSSTWPQIRAVGRFCVNVLAFEHGAVARRFAQRDGDRFADLVVAEGSHGPRIAGCVAWIDCQIVSESAAGDHTVVLAEVARIATEPNAPRPLVFHGGGFGSFEPCRGWRV